MDDFAPQQPISHQPSHKGRNVFLILVILVAVAVLIAVLEIKRRDAEAQLSQMNVERDELQIQSESEGQKAADRIVDQARRHIVIPDTVQPTVATIVDVESLRANNAFYAQAENGDHLIVTPEKAILFSSKRDIVIDVVPISLERSAGE